MRLSEPIEKHGFFWLPDDAENQVPGILRISEPGEVTLEVSYFYDLRQDVLNKRRRLGYPPNRSEDRNINRIVGRIDNGFITLDKCFYVNWNKKLPSGVSTSTIHANLAFIGADYNEGEDITFSKLKFSVEGLNEWLSISGFQKVPNRKDKSFFIHFNAPEEIAFNLPDGIELKFLFSGTHSLNFTEERITQKVYISLISKGLRPIGDFLDLVFKLHLFLCFAIDNIVSLDSVTGYSSEMTQEIGDGQKREIPIKIYYQLEPHSAAKPEVHPHDMLFCYRDIDDQLEEILTKWIKNYEVSKPSFNLYFSTMSGGQKYLDGKFLSLAQGIETLHRRNSQEPRMPEGQVLFLVEIIEAGDFNQQQARLAIPYRVSSPFEACA